MGFLFWKRPVDCVHEVKRREFDDLKLAVNKLAQRFLAESRFALTRLDALEAEEPDQPDLAQALRRVANGLDELAKAQTESGRAERMADLREVAEMVRGEK